MTREEFEKRLDLRVLRYDTAGCTQDSLKWSDRWNKLITPHVIHLLYQETPWGFYTYVVDPTGKAIRYTGFAWGYGGEGPRGLEEMIRRLGWIVPRSNVMPPAHIPGCWSIQSDGSVYDELV